jgi:ADP-heptose:LPS heptosyltransferase
MSTETTEAANLKRFARTTTLINFIKRNNGTWTHEQWLELVENIKAKGYAPIDFDQVGLILEERKQKYLSKKK